MKFEQLGNITNNLDNRRVPLNSVERCLKDTDGLYPYIGANNIVGYIDEFIFDEKILCIAEDGGSWGSGQICANIYEGKTWVNNHAHVLAENGKAVLEYLRYYLNYANLNKYITGTTRGKLTKGVLEKIKIPLPSIQEQHRIAARLSRAEGLIAKRRESLRLLDEYLKSVFLEMFGVKSNLKVKEYSLNELKSGGNETFSNGPFGSDLLTSELRNQGIPVIYIRDIRNGKFIWKSQVFLTEEKAETLSNCKILGEDVLIAKVGDPPGISAVYPKDFCMGIITQDVIRIRLNQNIILPSYFSFFINSEFGKQLIKKISIEGTRNRFPLGDFKKIKIHVPEMNLQTRFASIVEKAEALKARYRASLDELENLYGSMSKEAFGG